MSIIQTRTVLRKIVPMTIFKMFPPAVTTRSGQRLEVSLKSNESLKFAICSISFPYRPFAVFSDTSLRLFLA